MLCKTKGVVVKSIKYGETSLITTLYTELFGMQSFIVKGARAVTKKQTNKSNYYTIGAILEIVMYHQPTKNLQIVKEVKWAYMYKNLWTDITKQTVLIYMVELFTRCIKQPETNAELFYFLDDSFTLLDVGNNKAVGNWPLYFTLHLAAFLGFKINGSYKQEAPFLNLVEGNFEKEKPTHQLYLTPTLSQITSTILNLNGCSQLHQINLNRDTRITLLNAYQTYYQTHLADFGELHCLPILSEIMN
jgi:DNA repair protein RecO (recombination protein O)